MAIFLFVPQGFNTVLTRQHGSGMVEFLLVAMPLLLTALGGIEISHWMLTRQVVNLALTEAGRAGSTSHAHPQAIIDAFERALEPLYPPTSSATSAQRLHVAIHRNQHHHQRQGWHIQLMSPTPAHFQDFRVADPSVQHPSGLPTINNSYQLEQHQERQQQGWHDGQGPHSRQTVFEANTLALRLTWRYRPLLPGLEKVTGDLLSMKQDVTLTMQSHPVFWPDDPAGRVTRAAEPHPPVSDRDLPGSQPLIPGTGLDPGSGSPAPYPTGHAPADSDTASGNAGSAPGQAGGNGNPSTDLYGVSDTVQNTAPDHGSGSQTEGGGTPGDGHPGEVNTIYDEVNHGDGDAGTGVSDASICTNISPPFTMPSSDRARSSIASLPDLRS